MFTLVLVLRHSMDIDLDARISIRLLTHSVHVASLIPLEIFSLVSDPFGFFISLKDVALSNGLFLHYVMDKKSALEKSLALNIPNPSRGLLSRNYYNCCDFLSIFLQGPACSLFDADFHFGLPRIADQSLATCSIFIPKI